MTNFKIVTLTLAIAVAACASYPETVFMRSGDALVVEGVIDGTTTETLERALQSHPGVNKLVLRNIPGSADDESSLTNLSRLIRTNNLTTVVPSEGMVASGGTDMIVMGRNRIIESGACIGVHSWAAGGVFGSHAGADLSQSDPEHQLYLTFYQDMGITEEFYWFTLQAAGPDEIHWMSAEEINRFQLSETHVVELAAETELERQVRCDTRLL